MISWTPREKRGQDSKHPCWTHNCKIEKANNNTSRRHMLHTQCKYFIASLVGVQLPAFSYNHEHKSKSFQKNKLTTREFCKATHSKGKVWV